MKSFKYVLCIFLYILSIAKGYSQFIEGTHYQRIENNISEEFKFLFDNEEINDSKPIVIKLFTSACKPCFEIQDMLHLPEWQDLYEKINLLSLHTLRFDFDKQAISLFDYSTFTIYQVLQKIKNDPKNHFMFNPDQWYTIHKEFNDFLLSIKSKLENICIDMIVKNYINSKYANGFSSFAEVEFAKLFSQILNIETEKTSTNFELIYEHTLNLCKKIKLKTLPGFLVFTTNGIFLLEMEEQPTGKKELNQHLMLSVLHHVVNTYHN